MSTCAAAPAGEAQSVRLANAPGAWLYEYEHFLGRDPAQLCILLDEEPGEALVTYVEKRRGMLIAWFMDGCLRAGPRSLHELELAGIAF